MPLDRGYKMTRVQRPLPVSQSVPLPVTCCLLAWKDRTERKTQCAFIFYSAETRADIFKMKLACVLLLLAVVAVYQTEAGWWSKAVGWVKGAVGKVVGFFGKRDRRRRQLKEDLDVSSSRELDAVCQRFHLNELSPDGIPFEMVKVAFETIDQKGEGIDALNEKEMDLFLQTMEGFEYCLTRGKTSG